MKKRFFENRRHNFDLVFYKFISNQCYVVVGVRRWTSWRLYLCVDSINGREFYALLHLNSFILIIPILLLYRWINCLKLLVFVNFTLVSMARMRMNSKSGLFSWVYCIEGVFVLIVGEKWLGAGLLWKLLVVHLSANIEMDVEIHNLARMWERSSTTLKFRLKTSLSSRFVGVSIEWHMMTSLENFIEIKANRLFRRILLSIGWISSGAIESHD